MDEYRGFGVNVTSVDGMTVVALSGEWDLFAKETLHDALSTTGTQNDVVVDARAASFFDSSSLSEFVTFFKRVTERGRRFELLAGNSNIERILEITGLGKVLIPPADRIAFLEEHLPHSLAPTADNASLRRS